MVVSYCENFVPETQGKTVDIKGCHKNESKCEHQVNITLCAYVTTTSNKNEER